MNMGELIEQARIATGLSSDNFAALASLEPDRLESLISGEEVPDTKELDDVARALGVELADFMCGEVGANRMFFRSMNEDTSLRDVLARSDGLVLGDFLRCVGRVKYLRELLGESLVSTMRLDDVEPVPWSDMDENARPFEQGIRLAAHAREAWALGDEPIPSMMRFLGDLGVEVFYSLPGQLQSSLDGASTHAPHPAVLVNPVYDASPWYLRMTMAHELCHVLFDSFDGGPMFMLSPSSRARKGDRRWHFSDTYGEMEKRANAFAAHFLAPGPAIRRLIEASGVAAGSRDAVRLVSMRFGVGRMVAQTQINNVYKLSPGELSHASHGASDGESFDYDESPDSMGLIGGQLEALALKAFASGLIGSVEVRRMLNLPVGAELPGGRGGQLLTLERRAPVVSREHQVLTRAMRYLWDLGWGDDLYPSSAYSNSEGWTVTLGIHEGREVASSPRALFFTKDLELRDGT